MTLTFNRQAPSQEEQDIDDDDAVDAPPDAAMAAMMGFSTFGAKVESAAEKQAREIKLMQKRKRTFQSVDDDSATQGQVLYFGL
jgi:hypothetical protein